MNYTLATIPTPCYVINEDVLNHNLEVLRGVQRRAGCRILLALKAFAMFDVFPLIAKTLAGTAASSLYEARLGFEEFGDSVHLCAPGYRPNEMEDLLEYCGHVVFNSFAQWRRFRPVVERAKRDVLCAIRVNPEHSEVEVPIYDPCRAGSRLGVTRAHFEPDALDGLTGLHFHTLCGHNADALARTLGVVERKFGTFIRNLDWVNLGGGHHITRADYDVDALCSLISSFKERYGVEVYLEPGEAVVLDAGVLIASVLDILPDGGVILDVSATAHMPDVIEMPYRPDISGAGEPGRYPHTYRLGGPTCLAGDDIGVYSFPRELELDSRIVFEDMACYTMVKNTMFNGVPLPLIAKQTAKSTELRVVKQFDYLDYKHRLS